MLQVRVARHVKIYSCLTRPHCVHTADFAPVHQVAATTPLLIHDHYVIPEFSGQPADKLWCRTIQARVGVERVQEECAGSGEKVTDEVAGAGA